MSSYVIVKLHDVAFDADVEGIMTLVVYRRIDVVIQTIKWVSCWSDYCAGLNELRRVDSSYRKLFRRLAASMP